MDNASKTDDTQPPLGRPTAPGSFSVSARGFESEGHACTVGQCVGEYVRAFSRRFDLSHLDGVTVAYDYAQALRDLDRGYETSNQLTPSAGHAIGVAMTPSVLRDGMLKSHILLNAHVVEVIHDPSHENFELALHVIAHECAHVEVTAKFDAAFPGVLLRERPPDLRVALRRQVICACWDEYAATSLSAGIGADPTDGYEETFLLHAAEARQTANNHIKQYRTHGNVNRVLSEVYGTYGNLLKFAAYHLGNLDGQGIAVKDRPKTVEAMAGHWFAPYFAQLDAACQAVARSYGRWSNQEPFEAIGDIADELVRAGGVFFNYLRPGELYIDIPFTVDTMPDNE